MNGAHTEAEAFVLTKKKFFSNGKKATRVSGKKVELDDLLLPPKELPSRRQFHYIITLLRETEGDREKKPRDAKPPRKRTVRRGRARDGVPGPGYRYEIDATRIQIRIVSRYNPAQLMREATLYIIIDVWSGAIVGYALSLEPASWFLAAKALYNCFTPKSKVFKRLELPYGNEDWVSQHLPTRLAADRGEFVSDKAGVVPEIGLEVEIMPPMCPERKGSVEGKFEKVKHGDNFYLKPGKHKKNPQRREKDGKKEAAYTLMELEQLIVEIILDLNNDPVPIILVGTPRAAEILKSDVSTSRRIVEGGYHELERPESPDDPDFSALCEILWCYQWVIKPTDFSEPMRDLLYDLSQGITGIMITLFIAAQIEAIDSGKEELTKDLIKQVYDQRFKPLHSIIDALRTGKQSIISQYDDLYPKAFDGLRVDPLLSRIEEIHAQMAANQERALGIMDEVENAVDKKRKEKLDAATLLQAVPKR